MLKEEEVPVHRQDAAGCDDDAVPDEAVDVDDEAEADDVADD